MSEKEEGKICAILAWFFPIGLIWYFLDEKMKSNSFARFHVKQSLVLALTGIAFSILSVFVSFLIAIPVLGWLIGIAMLIFSMIFSLAMFIFWIMGLVGAIQGNEKELPLIGKFAAKFTF